MSKWKSPENTSEFIITRSIFLSWLDEYHSAEVTQARRAAGKKKRKARPPREKLKAIVQEMVQELDAT